MSIIHIVSNARQSASNNLDFIILIYILSYDYIGSDKLGEDEIEGEGKYTCTKENGELAE